MIDKGKAKQPWPKHKEQLFLERIYEWNKESIQNYINSTTNEIIQNYLKITKPERHANIGLSKQRHQV